MAEELNALRDKIDAVDRQLIDLLAARLALVGAVGEVKSRHGLPIYAPDREASMLARRRTEAELLGVPGDLIEDVLRRVISTSKPVGVSRSRSTVAAGRVAAGVRGGWSS